MVCIRRTGGRENREKEGCKGGKVGEGGDKKRGKHSQVRDDVHSYIPGTGERWWGLKESTVFNRLLALEVLVFLSVFLQ